MSTAVAKYIQVRLEAGRKYPVDGSKPLALEAVKWFCKNPVVATAGVIGFAMVAVPGAVSATALGAIGFTTNGVHAGSWMAAIQSAIGNVSAGSAFAFGQSAGAGGAALGVVNGVIQLGGAAITGGSAILGWFWQR